MKVLAGFILIFCGLVSTAFASQPSANELLSKASAQATKEHKNIFVMFDASW